MNTEKLLLQAAAQTTSERLPVLQGFFATRDSIIVNTLDAALIVPRDTLDIADGHYSARAVSLLAKGLKVRPDDTPFDEMPPVAPPVKGWVKINAAFWDAARAVDSATSWDATRQAIGRALWSKEHKAIVGTDGRRLHAVYGIAAPALMDGLPVGNRSKLGLLLSKWITGDGRVTRDKETSTLAWTNDVVTIMWKVYDSKTPAWWEVIPKGLGIGLALPEELIEGCGKLPKEFDGVSYKEGHWTAKSQGLTVDLGGWPDATNRDEPITEVGFNPTYLRQAVEFTGSHVLWINEACAPDINSPVLLHTLDGDRKAVLMPMRVH